MAQADLDIDGIMQQTTVAMRWPLCYMFRVRDSDRTSTEYLSKINTHR